MTMADPMNHEEDIGRAPAHPDRLGQRTAFGTPGKGSLTKYVGYSVSVVSFCAGIILLTGVFLRPTIPTELRMMCGVVFVLMGVYRYFATRFKMQALGRGDL
jgi:hypothetical protein